MPRRGRSTRMQVSHREKVRADSGGFLRGSHGPHGDPRGGLYGTFAGILQEKIRQRVSSAGMLMLIVCKGNTRECVSRAP